MRKTTATTATPATKWVRSPSTLLVLPPLDSQMRRELAAAAFCSEDSLRKAARGLPLRTALARRIEAAAQSLGFLSGKPGDGRAVNLWSAPR